MGKCMLALLLALPIPAVAQSSASLSSVPAAVEKRYNRLRSLQAEFVESVSYQGRNRRREAGAVYLLRPGKMRWEYTQPAGKLFVSDGKLFYLYSPNSNQVQTIKLKETGDLRAPLAFLLGQLDFRKEFGKLRLQETAEGIRLIAEARARQDAFHEVEFTIAAGTFEIRRIVIKGQDGLHTEFEFSGEILNPKVAAGLFLFQAPAGAEVLEAAR